ncbi:hypothetical protein FD754_000279 [Muntiacus muntjak]|uniref:Uncharacterized protein n=1 Tax=Muntiacus muntjak TaxID=9888 RepID=A0A5N3W3T5_MUNMU|nr:hypothetical protein FD754_000279 [Muntiacus muntjak]
MAWGPGPLTQSHPNTVAMPKRGKRLNFRAQDACSGRVTVVDYANSDPAVVRSGRVKEAIPAVEALSGAGESCDIIDSSGETDAQEESIQAQRRPGWTGGEEYPMDIWLLLASYICPEDIVNFPLICENAWTSVKKLLCLQACVIRSLYHMYEPSAARISENPIVGNRQEPMWEFNCNKCMGGLQTPIQYEDVHNNPDQDCCLLQVTTLNFIFIPIVMGMIFTLLVFQDYPVRGGQKLRSEQGVQVILNPAHSVRLFDWWHPQYPLSPSVDIASCHRGQP